MISVKGLDRIEGHAHIKIVENPETGSEECRIIVDEGIRFFEAFLTEVPLMEAPIIASRICGLCSASYSVCLSKAIEKALGHTIDYEAESYREAVQMISTARSHIAHVFLLWLPDILGVKSAFDVAEVSPETFKVAANLIVETTKAHEYLTGGEIHPVNMTVGGFTKLPRENVAKAAESLKNSVKQAEILIEKLSEILYKIPILEIKLPYVSIGNEEKYSLVNGPIKIDGVKAAKTAKDLIEEKPVSYSTAKRCTINGSAYVVGALSRLNNNPNSISSEAKSHLETLDIKEGDRNPFKIPLAQAVETAHLLQHVKTVLEEVEPPRPPEEIKLKAGKGEATIEAPRGILHINLTLSEKGRIKEINIIPPTTQNLLHMEYSATKYLIENPNHPQKAKMIEVLIRSYDPCISCSVQ